MVFAIAKVRNKNEKPNDFLTKEAINGCSRPIFDSAKVTSSWQKKETILLFCSQLFVSLRHKRKEYDTRE